MENCSLLLEASFTRAAARLDQCLIGDTVIAERIAAVALCPSNRAGVRLIMSCMLAKLDDRKVDVRKPYTKIGTADSFSGRTYDERFIAEFITRHSLPCNSTTAFLTPTLRNMDRTLKTNITLVGRPAEMYQNALLILDDVYAVRVSAQDVLDESVRLLIVERDAQQGRLQELISRLRRNADTLPLSSEATIALIQQHLTCKGASRLPVLIVAAAYKAAEERLGERVLRLLGHNSADEQTGAVGDVQITLVGDDDVVTSYEMKDKPVTRADIDRALQKIAEQGARVQNYLFISTAPAEAEVSEYARATYSETGVEIALLDCYSFLRHFLHLFHRLRRPFLDHYQSLLLAEPHSAVGPLLKEAFLALRQAAEAAE